MRELWIEPIPVFIHVDKLDGRLPSFSSIYLPGFQLSLLFGQYQIVPLDDGKMHVKNFQEM